MSEAEKITSSYFKSGLSFLGEVGSTLIGESIIVPISAKFVFCNKLFKYSLSSGFKSSLSKKSSSSMKMPSNIGTSSVFTFCGCKSAAASKIPSIVFSKFYLAVVK